MGHVKPMRRPSSEQFLLVQDNISQHILLSWMLLRPDRSAVIARILPPFLLQVMLPPKGDIYDTLSQNSRFSKLVELMKVATLSEELQLGGPYTFFAPTNEALDQVDKDVMNKLREDPDKLKSFLKHHIVVGESHHR